MLEGNILHRVTASDEVRPGVEGPYRATQFVLKATSEIPSFFNLELSRLEYETPIRRGKAIKRRWEVGRLHRTREAG
jgi:hypothetical protein